jgi:hypothetical protein
MTFLPYLVVRGPRAVQHGLSQAFLVQEAVSEQVVARYSWRQAAEEEANRLNLAAGACRECMGRGTLVIQYEDGSPKVMDCSDCSGLGRNKPPDRSVSLGTRDRVSSVA